MILHSQLEVGEGNGDEGCHNDEDDEDDEEDGVDCVDLVAPHAGKDVVQLYVDGAERQEACTNHKVHQKLLRQVGIAISACSMMLKQCLQMHSSALTCFILLCRLSDW